MAGPIRIIPDAPQGIPDCGIATKTKALAALQIIWRARREEIQ